MKKRITLLAIVLGMVCLSSFAQKGLPNAPKKISFSLMQDQQELQHGAPALPLAAQNAPLNVTTKTVYAGLFSDQLYKTGGLSTFDNANPWQTFHLLKPLEEKPELAWIAPRAGAYANGKFYTYLYRIYSFTTRQEGFGYFDMNTGNFIKLANITTVGTDGDLSLCEAVYSMSYDNTNNVMYCLFYQTADHYGHINACYLAKINLETGVYTPVKQLSRSYYNIAVDDAGKIYALSPNNEYTKTLLYELTPNAAGNDAEETELMEVKDEAGQSIPGTNVMQDMDFDHDDWVIRWNHITQGRISTWTTLDVKNGKKGAYDVLYAQFAGLYIPFKPAGSPSAPDRVTNIQAAVGESDITKATLSWTNPTKCWNKDDLTELTDVKIYRNGTEIATVSPVQIGQSSSYTDETAPAGVNTYVFIPRKADGVNGKSDSIKCYVGEDLPGGPKNVTLTSANGKVGEITWEAPTVGMHEGWFDNTTLKYTIVRMPDSVTVAQDVTETTYSDNSVAKMDKYSYRVFSVNAKGMGEYTESNTLALGPAIVPPYTGTFSNQADAGLWTIFDPDNNGIGWEYLDYWGAFASRDDGSKNDWLFSPDFYLENGKGYRVRFLLRKHQFNPVDKFERLEIKYGKGKTIEAMTNLVADIDPIDNDDDRYYSFMISPAETDTYNFGLRCHSDNGTYGTYFSAFNITPVNPNDMIAREIIGMKEISAKAASNYNIVVGNNGVNDVTSYKVQIVDDDDNVLAETEVNETLAPQEDKTVVVAWTPDESLVGKTVKINGRVILDGDGDASNDNTASIDVKVTPYEGGKWVVFDGRDNWEKTVSSSIPYGYAFKNTTSQTIYPKEMMGLVEGNYKIAKIAYEYDFATKSDVQVSILAGMTTQDRFDINNEQWLEESIFTEMVSEESISLYPGSDMLVFTFSQPFEYSTANNFALTVIKTGFDSNIYDNRFNCVKDINVDDNLNPIIRVLRFESNKNEWSWSRTPTITMDMPITHFYVIPAGGSGIEEIVVGPFAYNLNDGKLDIVANEAIKDVAVYGLDGTLRIQGKATGEQKMTINVSNLKRGAYILKVNNKSMKFAIK